MVAGYDYMLIFVVIRKYFDAQPRGIPYMDIFPHFFAVSQTGNLIFGKRLFKCRYTLLRLPARNP